MNQNLSEAERAVIDAMRATVAHGFGEIHVVVADGRIDIQEGKRTRFKIKH